MLFAAMTMCLSSCTKDEFSKLMAYLKDNEIAAFTTAGNVSEVYGLWTKHSKKKALKSEAESR